MIKTLKITAILVVQFSFAQLDHVTKFNTENWGASRNVTTIEEYKYNGSSAKPFITTVYNFKDGKLQTLEELDSNKKRTEKFEYNAKGKPVKYTVSYSDGKSYSSNFIYDKKGYLIEISPNDAVHSWRLKYQYDSEGKLTSIEKYINNRLSDKGIVTSYKDGENYDYRVEMYSSSDGKKINESNRQFINGMEVKDKNLLAFGIDELGSILKIREKDFVFQTYFFYSRRIIYNDGKITGSTDYNPYFTEGVNADISQLSENKNPKATYKIRMGDDGKFKMAYTDNNIIPDLSKGFISPNKTDFIYFDPNNGEVALVENMQPSTDYVKMKPYNTPSKKYIVVNTDYQFIVFDNGRQIDTSNLKISQNLNNLVISENGVVKYFVPNLDRLTFLKYYPLYILAY